MVIIEIKMSRYDVSRGWKKKETKQARPNLGKTVAKEQEEQGAAARQGE